MAGTIVTTPALGASDWSSWITQQGLTDRGFMRVSLTNMSGSAASTVGAGSVLECAGAIYSFTDTAITLAAATASANVAVYFVAIPAAGGTTCTVVMDSTAPVWVDARQGFYASAASVSRAIGGCYLGTSGTFYNKYLYEGDILTYCLQASAMRPLLQRVVQLGEWNMDTTEDLDVLLEVIPGSAIRNIFGWVRDDSGDLYYPIGTTLGPGTANATGTFIYFVSVAGVTTVRLQRTVNGVFDNASWNGTASTVANRGWLSIVYEA